MPVCPRFGSVCLRLTAIRLGRKAAISLEIASLVLKHKEGYMQHLFGCKLP